MARVADEIAALRGTKPATFGNLLRHGSFSRLWRAMLVSSLGDWVGFLAVTSLVVGRSDRNPAFAVAGVMIARLLPSIFFGPFAGVLVDRFDRRRLMVTADVVRGAAYASMPFIPNLAGIFVLSFGIECFSLVWTPARDASLPNLVPRRQLVNASTLGLATTYGTLPLAGVVFTALTGVAAGLSPLVPYLGDHREALALWVEGLAFAFSAYMISGLTLPAPKLRTGEKLRPAQAFSDLREGILFLRDHPFPRAMTIGIVLAFMGVGSVMGLGPIFARRTLGAGAEGWGVLVTAVGIGLVIGMGSLGLISRAAPKHRIFPIAMLMAAVTLLVLAVMPNLFLAATFTVLLGAAAGATWVTGYTLLQENIADEIRGRTFATLTVLSRLGLFLSLAGFPLLAGAVGNHTIEIGGTSIDLAGTRLALWAGAAIGLLSSVLTRRGLAGTRLAQHHPLTLHPRLRKVERRGAFVAFEGVEGSGKGTQIRLARDFLESQGFEVLMTREPGGTDLGERLRDALLQSNIGTIDPRAEAMLFSAARAQHVASVIRPALEDGKVVLCDRYIDSSLAYQGAARGLGEADVLSLNVWATQGLFPDLVILLDVEPEAGLARAGADRDRIEAEDDTFHAKVAEAYAHIADEHPERVVVVDASGPPRMVNERVNEALAKFFKIGEA
ncbi:MAG TPA: dTMP kinase [Actinomycetota bacterium]|nr:dTMP kinase [Actinomycetota bacterium]